MCPAFNYNKAQSQVQVQEGNEGNIYGNDGEKVSMSPILKPQFQSQSQSKSQFNQQDNGNNNNSSRTEEPQGNSGYFKIFEIFKTFHTSQWLKKNIYEASFFVNNAQVQN